MIPLPKHLFTFFGLAVLSWGAAGVPRASAGDEPADPLPAGARLRLGTGRFRHDAAVTRIFALPDGQRLLTIAQDMKARVWDIATGKQLAQIALSSDGRFTNLLYSVAPDGKTLAAANGLDNTIRIYTLADGKESLVFSSIPVAQGLLALEYSSDGKQLVSSHRDHTYRIWDVATAKELRTLGQPVNPAAGSQFSGRVHFLPDGKGLAIIEDWAVRILDVEDGKELRWFGGHTAQVQALAFSPDGKHMATVAYDRAARLWDLATGKTVAKFPLPAGGGRDLAFPADGKTLVICGGDRLVRLFDVAGGKLTAQIEVGAGFAIPAFALSPDGKSLYVSGNEWVLHGYDTATGKELFPTTGHAGPVQALVWSADGKFLATSGQSDQSVLLWDAVSGKLIRRMSTAEPASYTQLQFTPDSKTLLGYSTARTVHVWDVAEGKETSSFVVAPVQPYPPAFSHDGKLAAVLGNDRIIRIWDIAAEKQLHQFEVKPAAPARGAYFAYLFFTGDNRTLVAYSSSERSVRRWDALAGKELSEAKGVNLLFGVAASPAADGWSSLHHQGAAINMIEVATGKPRLTLTIPAAPPAPGAPPRFVTVTGAALSRDGRTVAALTADGTLSFWDTGSAKVLIERKHVATGTRHVAFAPDGKTVATAGNDGGVMLWDVPGPMAEGRLVVKSLTANAAAALWNDISSDDPRRAWQAILTLAAAPKESVPLAEKQLKPAAPVDEKQIAQWIKSLDAEGFQERDEATESLVRAGHSAEDAVRKALVKPPSAESKQRLESILAKLSGKQGPKLEEVRALRAVELLEKMGTAEAQAVLEEVAKGSDETAKAAARAALERIKGRNAMP